jgi:creatinine amidohydrolase/Fe(II)-dependent formamide hydrolase-like protein
MIEPMPMDPQRLAALRAFVGKRMQDQDDRIAREVSALLADRDYHVGRIAELEGERAQIWTAIGLPADATTADAVTSVRGLSDALDGCIDDLARATDEAATLRVILASVPAPEDEP